MYEKTCIQTRIQMYKKNAQKCMKKSRMQMYEKKPAYKCMTKTRIRNRIQMYDKNAYKIAFKCMTKNTHTNV